MKWIGVITGDIVGSSEILKAGERDKLLEVMKSTVEEINEAEECGSVKMNIYRGDSFQIIVDSYTSTLYIALTIRANLIANSNDKLRWDARIGIGVGKGEYISDKVTESDGEAFHLSGKAFDKIKTSSRMYILTPSGSFSSALLVSTNFADDIISNWTVPQAKIFYLMHSKDLSQKEVSKIEKKAPQTISKIYLAGKQNLIVTYLSYFFVESQLTKQKLEVAINHD